MDPGPTDVHGLTPAVLRRPAPVRCPTDAAAAATREPGRPQRRLRLRVPGRRSPPLRRRSARRRRSCAHSNSADLLDLDLDSLSLAAVGPALEHRPGKRRIARTVYKRLRNDRKASTGRPRRSRPVRSKHRASLVPDASPPARNSAGSARSRRATPPTRCSFPVFPLARQPRPCQHMAHRDELKSPATTKVGSPAAGASVASSRAASASAPD